MYFDLSKVREYKDGEGQGGISIPTLLKGSMMYN
jgi:hypothetical protein